MPNRNVLTGTWEEILLHSKELEGKRISLTILEPVSEARDGEMETNEVAEKRLAEIVEELFLEAERTGGEPGKSGSDPHEMGFGEIVAKKYRAQGFDI